MLLKRKIYIAATVLLALIILLTVFIISPFFLEIKRNSYNFPLKKQNLAVLEKELENLQEFKKTWPEISPNLEKINRLFIDDPRMPIDFISFLEETAEDAGFYRDKSFEKSFSDPVKNEGDPWPCVPFNLSLIGSFSSVSNFLEKLESGPYLIEIQNLSITRLTDVNLRTSEFKQFSLDDTKAVISIKVYSK
ncbi:hypothetical protein AMJ48_00390 [Parcubacteria bacterium DG_74_1]|nr:MAG: hypothetical protein AMJ48_00390 [Parcubacteria bacterium DG_74_1]